MVSMLRPHLLSGIFLGVAALASCFAACSTVEVRRRGGAGGEDGSVEPSEPAPAWSRDFGGNDESIANTIGFTPDGDVIVGGFWWRGTRPFDLGCGDLGPSYTAEYDMFLVRFDASGACVWSRSFGSPQGGWDTVHELAVDPNGDVVFTGSLGGDVDFAPEAPGGELDARGIASAQVVKLDGLSGAHVWSLALYGDAATVTGYGIATDSTGDVLVTGRLYGTAYFGSVSLSPADGSDAFIVKLDGPSGQVIWATQLSYAASDEGRAIAVDANDDVIVAGKADDSALPAADLFVAKIDGATGDRLWEHKWIGGQSDEADITGVGVTPDQDFVVSGELQGSLQLGQPAVVSTGADGFVAKLSRGQGIAQWPRLIGGPATERVYGLATDGKGTTYVTGVATGSANDRNLLVASLDGEGNVSQNDWGDDQDQVGIDIAVGPQGQIGVVGHFLGQLPIYGVDTLDCEIAPGVACDPQTSYAHAFVAVFTP